jgi:hypothetical protein
MQRQARAPQTQPFGADAFEAADTTVLRWLGMAGFLINSRGTTLIVDPLLGGFDMPVMIEFPIAATAVPRLDAALVTHSDNDHYSVPTCRDLARVTGEYHPTRYVASLMKQEGFPAYGHDIGEHFAIGPVRVEVTPADHAWQNASPGASDRIFEPEDACGFWIDTPDGTIWAPGIHGSSPTITCACRPRCDAVRLLRQRVALRTRCDRDGERLPTHPVAAAPLGLRGCSRFRGHSMPTRTRCQNGWRTRNASVSWRPASPSCCGD